MLLDAIVLAGGRSSRLGGEPKQHLIVDGRSLLHRTLDAAREAGAQRVVVVGEPALAAEIAGALAGTGTGTGADRGASIEVVREEPAFGGPVAAIAAGVAALGMTAPGMSALGQASASARTPSSGEHGILVLACDMPGCADAVAALVIAAGETAHGARGHRQGGVDGFAAVDASGRRQHLLALYDAAALTAAVQRVGARLDGLAVRTLVEPLELREVPIPAGAADDVDTWDDAERLGARSPLERRSPDEC
ncbi:NTP transferase domain-containing protein [Herbiconiux sp.]|uniref:molybdenum cofactor guanylyltransferase n=1 Tax=Herbiconiux sp. TaxID=1871186 RepID=UPI0025C40C22|nr:NTP transferase domain-containing protein [Herbiconiux sp.]